MKILMAMKILMKNYLVGIEKTYRPSLVVKGLNTIICNAASLQVHWFHCSWNSAGRSHCVSGRDEQDQ